jgi:dihydroorotase
VAFDLILRGGTLLTSDGFQGSDLAIENGKIMAIGDLTSASAKEVREVSGLTIMPGGIDTQVHFREPGLEQKEDLESGSRAALHGGITAFLEMPNTKPETITPQALQDKLDRAAGRSWVHYGFFVGATPDNAHRLSEYENLPGTPGVKMFMGSSTGDLLVDADADVLQVLKHGKKRVAVHSEDEARNVTRKALISSQPHAREHPFLRDAESARLSTERLIRLCEETGRPVHILHISTADELPLIRDAKKRGLPVTCEITPQHLWFTAPDCYENLGTKAQMNPPLRTADHNQALWEALEEGLFDVFGSDHAPHTQEEKAKPYPQSPSGMPGVETLLPVLLTYCAQGRLGYPKLVEMLCERPAAMYGMLGKGQLSVGFDADLTLVDLQKKWQVDEAQLQSRCGWSPYHGTTLTGQVQSVYLDGVNALLAGERTHNRKGRQLSFR